MTLSRPTQWLILGLLCLLLLSTRGEHFASIDALPSASWAVFFLAGVFFRPTAGFAVLFALASVIDLAMLEAGQISTHCLSPAYWTLIPAYGALWFAGREYARRHRHGVATLVPLSLAMLIGGFIAALFAKGGYYLLSGSESAPTLGGLVDRLLGGYPGALGTLVLYVAMVAIAWLAAQRWRAPASLAPAAR